MMKQLTNNKTTKGVLLGVLVLSALFTIPHFLSLFGLHSSPTQHKEASSAASVLAPFARLTFSAQSVYVYDAHTGEVLFEKNAHASLPLASVTKVMTGLVSAELAPDSTRVAITSEALTPSGDSGLLVGETWELGDLRDFTLVSSSNDGAYALASVGAFIQGNTLTEKTPQEQFIEHMNKRAKDLGLHQTYFLNTSGLDKSEDTAGGFGSARDMAHLFAFLVEEKPGVLAATAATAFSVSSNTQTLRVENTNTAVDSIPGLIASKTGFTDLAGGNLVVAFDAGLNRPIVVAVLGSTEEDRFSDVEKLVSASIEAIQLPEEQKDN